MFFDQCFDMYKNANLDFMKPFQKALDLYTEMGQSAKVTYSLIGKVSQEPRLLESCWKTTHSKLEFLEERLTCLKKLCELQPSRTDTRHSLMELYKNLIPVVLKVWEGATPLNERQQALFSLCLKEFGIQSHRNPQLVMVPANFWSSTLQQRPSNKHLQFDVALQRYIIDRNTCFQAVVCGLVGHTLDISLDMIHLYKDEEPNVCYSFLRDGSCRCPLARSGHDFETKIAKVIETRQKIAVHAFGMDALHASYAEYCPPDIAEKIKPAFDSAFQDLFSALFPHTNSFPDILQKFRSNLYLNPSLLAGFNSWSIYHLIHNGPTPFSFIEGDNENHLSRSNVVMKCHRVAKLTKSNHVELHLNALESPVAGIGTTPDHRTGRIQSIHRQFYWGDPRKLVKNGAVLTTGYLLMCARLAVTPSARYCLDILTPIMLHLLSKV